ncbi:hypothetical protein BDZ91DRAFT_767259 [Kalaharituber pfeilii]|nr:hypothetical protein BDZ91DRAFT_767259 [Kalaharituber pfeilii]
MQRTNNAREAAAGVDRAADGTLVDNVGASIVDVGNGPLVLVYIIDPSDNACYTATNADPGAVAPQPVRWGKWDLTGKYRARFIIPTKSLEDVYKGVKSKIPAGRSIRAIYGCLVLLRPGVVVNPNADIERLTTDAEFAAFLQDTASKPIALQVVLKHNGRADTPPPDGQPYFAADHFVLEEYNDPAEDSDTFIRLANGGAKRVMPKTDAGFENRKMQVRKRIARQQALLTALKNKHVGIHGQQVNIIDSDDEEWLYMQHLDPVSGGQVIEMRPYASAGLTEFNARRAAGSSRAASRRLGPRKAKADWDAANP